MPHRAVSLTRHNGAYVVGLDDGRVLQARAVVIACGVQYRRLPLERLQDFEGAGVFYAAMDLEARYCHDGDVYVVGGGNSAGQAAMFLSRHARRVHMLVRGASLATSMSEYLVKRLTSNPHMVIHTHAEVEGLHGADVLSAITIRRTTPVQENERTRGPSSS